MGIRAFLLVMILCLPWYAKAQSTQKTIDSLLAALPPAKDDTNKVRLLTEISRAYFQVDPVEGIKFGKYALELSQDLKYPFGEVISYNAIARCYAAQNDWSSALHYYSIALEKAEKLKLYKITGDQHLGISNIYARKREFDRSLSHIKLAQAAYDKDGVKNQQMVMNSFATVYTNKGEHTTALKYYWDGIAMEKADNAQPAVLATLYSNIGGNHLLLKNYDSGLYYLLKALEYNIATGNHISTTSNLNNISNLYTALANLKAAELPPGLRDRNENLAKALAYEQQALELTYKASLPYYRQGTYENFAYTYESMGDYKMALEYASLSYELRDSLWQMSKEREFARVEAEARFQKATDSLRYENLELKRKRGIRTSMIGIIVIAAIGCIAVINMQKQKHKQKRKMAEAERQRVEELAQQQLKDFTTHIQEKNELIEVITTEIEKLKLGDSGSAGIIDEAVLRELETSVLVTDEQWDRFKSSFDKIHSGYLSRLKNKLPDVTPAETRFIVLSKLNLSAKEMAGMLGVSSPAVRASKYRLMKKLGIEDDAVLDNLIQSI